MKRADKHETRLIQHLTHDITSEASEFVLSERENQPAWNSHWIPRRIEMHNSKS